VFSWNFQVLKHAAAALALAIGSAAPLAWADVVAPAADTALRLPQSPITANDGAMQLMNDANWALSVGDATKKQASRAETVSLIYEADAAAPSAPSRVVAPEPSVRWPMWLGALVGVVLLLTSAVLVPLALRRSSRRGRRSSRRRSYSRL
jgi:hypothetical protein